MVDMALDGIRRGAPTKLGQSAPAKLGQSAPGKGGA
jgi:hypothetical protein